MKINNIRIIIYGAVIFGAFIAFVPGWIHVLSDYATVFIYIGGALVVSGAIFGIICLRYHSCSNCREYLHFKEVSTNHCPLCRKKS